jgi:hypothetical protein
MSSLRPLRKTRAQLQGVAAGRGRSRRILLSARAVGSPQDHAAPPGASGLAHVRSREFLWYYWQPARRDPDCPSLLQKREALTTARLEVRASRPPGGRLLELVQALKREPGAPLRIAAIFGYVDHQSPRPTANEVAACIEPAEEPDGCNGLEWGALQYVGFVRALRRELVDPQESWVEDAGERLRVIRGRLRRSGRPLELRAELLETDQLAPPPLVARHAPRLLAALARADVLLYVGHSGLGANLSVAELSRALPAPQVDRVLRGSPTRLVAFLGCYTYSYFGPDLALRLRGGAGRDALFVYTGSGVSELTEAALHVLATLDCVLALAPGTAPGAACAAARPTEDFLIYDYARRGSAP